MSENYRYLIRTYTRNVQTAQPQNASARTWLNSAEAFVYGEMGRGKDGDGAYAQLLDGPTSEAWIDPWVAHLRALGVRMRLGHAVEALETQRSQIASARVRDAHGRHRRVEADWYVCALPVGAARRLWSRPILTADPRLETMRSLRSDWMNGIQLYLRREVPINRGHVVYGDSPWAISSISQAQF